MRDDWSKTQVASTLLAVAVGFTFAIAGCYIWLLPKVFDGYKTPSILVLGVLCSFVSGGYIGSKCSGAPARSMRICIAMFSGLSVAAFVAYCSMFIILNVIGS